MDILKCAQRLETIPARDVIELRKIIRRMDKRLEAMTTEVGAQTRRAAEAERRERELAMRLTHIIERSQGG